MQKHVCTLMHTHTRTHSHPVYTCIYMQHTMTHIPHTWEFRQQLPCGWSKTPDVCPGALTEAEPPGLCSAGSLQSSTLAAGILAKQEPYLLPLTDSLGPSKEVVSQNPWLWVIRNHFSDNSGRQKIARLVPVPMRSPLFLLPCALTMLLITWPAVEAHVGVHCSESCEGTARIKRT